MPSQVQVEALAVALAVPEERVLAVVLAQWYGVQRDPQTLVADDREIRLSRLLWDAREIAEKYAGVAERITGKPDGHARRVVAEIDTFRAERGWLARPPDPDVRRS